MLCPRRGGAAGHRRGRARLLPVARRDHGTVGRSGRAGVHRRGSRRGVLDRNGLRPMRWYATARTGSWRARPKPGRSTWPAEGRVRRGKLGPGQMLVVDPATADCSSDPAAGGARRSTGTGRTRSSRGSRRAIRRRPRSMSSGAAVAPRLDPRRDVVGAAAGGRGGQGAHLLHGRRHGDRAVLVVEPAAVPPLQAALRAGHQPADRPPPRTARVVRTVLGPRDPVLWERPEAASMFEYPTFLLFRPPGGFHLDATGRVA